MCAKAPRIAPLAVRSFARLFGSKVGASHLEGLIFFFSLSLVLFFLPSFLPVSHVGFWFLLFVVALFASCFKILFCFCFSVYCLVSFIIVLDLFFFRILFLLFFLFIFGFVSCLKTRCCFVLFFFCLLFCFE